MQEHSWARIKMDEDALSRKQTVRSRFALAGTFLLMAFFISLSIRAINKLKHIQQLIKQEYFHAGFEYGRVADLAPVTSYEDAWKDFSERVGSKEVPHA